MNTRAKGQRNERRAETSLKDDGYDIFRLYQPVYAAQGPIDLIAVGFGRVRFIQVRSNRWGDLRPLKALVSTSGLESITCCTFEVWRYTDHRPDPTIRFLS